MVCERFEHNDVYLSGVVASTPEDSERVFGEEMLPIRLDVLRLSGEVDEIPIYVPVKLAATTPGLSLEEGDFVSIHGQVRTVRLENGKHAVKVVADMVANRTPECGYSNRVCFTGEVNAWVDRYDTSRTNRRLAKVSLSIPYSSTEYGGTAHLCALFWGSTADAAASSEKGDVVAVCGRLQSRVKQLSSENGGGDFHCVEVSATTFTPLGKAILNGKGIFG